MVRVWMGGYVRMEHERGGSDSGGRVLGLGL
jgi:hypothetical protein